MTAAVYRNGTPSMSVPLTQKTAPVYEFNCLYTHDLRRKQKRWQDGFLKFHTFNKRIMVYDIPRNFIGDAFHKTGEVLHDGDELILEKGGVLVQVAENVGMTQTDLTELLQPRKKKPTCHENASSSVAPYPAPRPQAQQRSRTTTQSKHLSLRAMLGTPEGPIGKAKLPSKSPYEQRQAEQKDIDWQEGRLVKRQRIEQPAWTVSRTTKVAGSPPTIKPPPLWAHSNEAYANKKRTRTPTERGQQKLGTKEIIDLSDDNVQPGSDQFLAGFSSDALVAPSSPHRPPADRLHGAWSNVRSMRSSSPTYHTRQVPADANLRRRQVRPVVEETPHPSLQSGKPFGPIEIQDGDEEVSQPRKANESNFGSTDGRTVVVSKVSLMARSESPALPVEHPSAKRAVRTLRIASSGPRKKGLLCQSQVSSRVPPPLVGGKAETPHSVEQDTGAQASEQRHKSQLAQLDDRLSKMDAKQRKTDLDKRSCKRPELHVQTNHTTNGAASAIDIAPQTPAAQVIVTPTDLDDATLFLNGSPVVSPHRSTTILPVAYEPSDLHGVTSDAGTTFTKKPKRSFGAPVRITPSPVKQTKATSAFPTADAHNTNSLPKIDAAPPKKWKRKKPLQRAADINVTSHGTSSVILGRPFKPPKIADENETEEEKPPEPRRDPEPWSREAFDLFEWRPPGWEEERWCLNIGDGTGMAGPDDALRLRQESRDDM